MSAVLLALGLFLLRPLWDEAPANEESAEAPFAFLFDGRHLPIFELSLPESSYRNLAADPFVFQPADFTYRSPTNARDKIVLPAVGVRLKGQASFEPIGRKPALRIRFDKYVKRQHFFGLRRLTLNNMAQDPSMVRERLAHHVFRKAGLVAPLCNSARVFVNGSYFGLYANVQTIDRVFVRTHFEPVHGNLYDISREYYRIDLVPGWKPYFVLKTNRAENDTSDLDELIRTIDAPPPAFVLAAESVVDLDQWLAVGAVQAVNADWDSYFFGPNNYSLYHDPGDDRFLLLPRGGDQAFGMLNGRFRYLRYPISGPREPRRGGQLFRRCQVSPECYDRYLDEVERTLQLWESLDLPAELDRIVDQITPSVFEDKRRGYPYQRFERAVDDVRTFLHRRGGRGHREPAKRPAA
jgi:spore coat protein CotH